MPHQVAGQGLQVFHLFRRGPALVVIADQADADGLSIHGFTGHVPALQLAAPALPDIDLAIRHAVSIANDEVVSKAV